jgi:hypothetical protein
MQFAKFFNHEDVGQVLVRKDTDCNGECTVSVEIHIELLGYAKTEYQVENDEHQDKLFDSIDETKATKVAEIMANYGKPAMQTDK